MGLEPVDGGWHPDGRPVGEPDWTATLLGPVQHAPALDRRHAGADVRELALVGAPAVEQRSGRRATPGGSPRPSGHAGLAQRPHPPAGRRGVRLLEAADYPPALLPAWLDPEPELAQPALMQPESVDPRFARPQFVEPQFAQPQFAQPQFAHPQFVQPQLVQPEFAQPQFVQPQFAEPQFSRPDVAHQDFAQPHALLPAPPAPLPAAQPPAAPVPAAPAPAAQPHAAPVPAVQPFPEPLLPPVPRRDPLPTRRELRARREAAQPLPAPEPTQRQVVRPAPSRAEAVTPVPPERKRAPRGAGRPARRGPQLLSLSMPQVGIAGALGLATIAAPLTGLLAAPARTPANPAVRSSMAGAPAFPELAQGPNAVEDLQLVPSDGLQPSVPAALGAPRTILVGRASRGSERAVLPGCNGLVPLPGRTNGAVPAADLCTLWDPAHHQLRADAAVALAKLNIAYRKRFGHDMCISDGYRTLAQQYAVKEARGGYAATPGTSEHGFGIAVDLCDGVTSDTSATYWWLRNNAAAYGWYNPKWALAGGVGPHEPWHWQFLPGEESLGIAPN